MIEAVILLDTRLREADIPIAGVAEIEPGVFRVDFALEATQQQRDQAAAIVTAFDPAAELAVLEATIEAERTGFAGLAADIGNELDWITTAIAEIDTGLGLVDAATLAQLRAIVEGVLQNQRRILLEQRGELRAWRYVVRRL